MAICRACLAEGKAILLMDQDFVNKFNIFTNLDIKPEETLYTCRECATAVKFCIEFREKCIASNIAFKILKKTKKDITSKPPNQDDQIIIKEELKVEYDDSQIEYEHLENFGDDDDDEISLSKLSAAIHGKDIELSEKEDSAQHVKVAVKRRITRTCPKRVAKKVVVKKVQEITQIESSEPCGLCPKTLKNMEDLKKHLGNHKLEVPCSFCPQHFIGLPHLYSHRILHIPEDKKRCHLCNKIAWNIEFLEFHYMRAHNMADKDEHLRCKLCTKTTASVKQMHRHMKNHEEHNYKCKVCHKSFARQHTLRLHAFVHNTEKLRCEKCDFVTNSPKGLAHHQLRKHTEGRVYCKVCHRPFKTQTLCDKHKCRTRDSIVCSVCGFVAKNDKSYQMHKSVHDTVMRYKCEQCPAKFRSKSSFKIHRDQHAGTPRQICGVCGRAFYSASVLIKHRRVHTGEKPYVCEVCSKGFTGNHNLKVHMKIHGIYNLIKPKTAAKDESLDVDK